MNVLVVEPGYLPYEKEINGLEEMQAVVGGLIEPIYPYEERVALAGMGIDPFIRSLVAGIQLRPRPPDEYPKLLRELSAIGNNINQIAYWANAQKSIHEAEIVDAAVLARKAWELVKNGL